MLAGRLCSESRWAVIESARKEPQFRDASALRTATMSEPITACNARLSSEPIHFNRVNRVFRAESSTSTELNPNDNDPALTALVIFPHSHD